MDVVNAHFKKFYPAEFDEECWEFSSMLGGMRSYRAPGVSSIFPAIVCADGFKISVQGHAGAYSSPRDDFADEYSSVEIGFPSAHEELLIPYHDGDGDQTNSVFGFVPVSVAIDIINKHGGIAEQ